MTHRSYGPGLWPQSADLEMQEVSVTHRLYGPALSLCWPRLASEMQEVSMTHRLYSP